MEPQAFPPGSDQDALYAAAVADYGDAIARLANFYEFRADLRAELVQDIHVALWRSFETFAGRCSLRTWVYRVAHNTAASHVDRGRRTPGAVALDVEDFDAVPADDDVERTVDERRALHRLRGLVHRLPSPDRQIVLLYLEDVDAAAIGEVVGLSPGAVATRIHRLKTALAQAMREGASQ